MARAVYLADTSAFTRFARPAVVAAVAPMIAAGHVAVCRPVMFELGFSARNQADYDLIMEGLEAYECVPVTEGDQLRALEVQGLLAARGQHRALSLVDGLVAAAAESRGLSVLHYDADFETVALLTGQTQRWLVPAGTAD